MVAWSHSGAPAGRVLRSALRRLVTTAVGDVIGLVARHIPGRSSSWVADFSRSMCSPADASAGNPLAVVLDAGGLDEASMQAIAREFNLAETVFVLPAQEPSGRARLRIFTPAAELPFAGHPTVGTAVLLNRIDGGAARKMVLEEGIGPIHCATDSIDSDRRRARFELTQLPVEVGKPANS